MFADVSARNSTSIARETKSCLKLRNVLKLKLAIRPMTSGGTRMGLSIRRKIQGRKVTVASAGGESPDTLLSSKKNFRKKWWMNCLFVALTALAGAFVTPSLISTKAGSSVLCKAVSSFIPGELKIKKVQVLWTKPMKLSCCRVYPYASHVPALHVDSFSSSSTLWHAIFQRNVRDIRVSGLELDISSNSKGTPRIFRAFLNDEEKEHIERTNMPISSKILSINIDGTDVGILLEDSRLIVDESVSSVVGNAISVTVNALPLPSESGELQVSGAIADQHVETAELYQCKSISEGVGLDCVFSSLDGVYRLEDKAHLKLRPTAALLSMILSRINPLLSDIISVKSSNIDLYIWPETGRFDSDTWRFEISPIDAEFEGGGITNSILEFLQNFSKVETKQKAVRTNAVYSCQVAKLSGCFSKQGELELQESVLVCGWKTGKFCLTLAGNTRTEGSSVFFDSTVGIPREDLERLLKLHNLPSGYSLRFHVGGTQDKPIVDWKSSTQEILRLFAQQMIGVGSQAIARKFQSILQDRANQGYFS